jgi:hypothetical protein
MNNAWGGRKASSSLAFQALSSQLARPAPWLRDTAAKALNGIAHEDDRAPQQLVEACESPAHDFETGGGKGSWCKARL